MKKLTLIILLTGLFSSVGGYAQKVYKDGEKVVLDLTVESGMPAGSVTDKKKPTWDTASDDKYLVSGEYTDAENAKAYHKLEIAPYNINTAKEITGSGTKTMPWVAAYNVCKDTDYSGGGWRLPTQRELMLMYIFREALNDFCSENFVGNNSEYWSVTESMSYVVPNPIDKAWTVRFNFGNVYVEEKTNSFSARCVREVP